MTEFDELEDLLEKLAEEPDLDALERMHKQDGFDSQHLLHYRAGWGEGVRAALRLLRQRIHPQGNQPEGEFCVMPTGKDQHFFVFFRNHCVLTYVQHAAACHILWVNDAHFPWIFTNQAQPSIAALEALVRERYYGTAQ